MLIMCSNF